MKKIKYSLCILISLLTVFYPVSVFSAGYDGISVGNINIASGTENNFEKAEIPALKESVQQTVMYTPTELTDRTYEFFATVENTVNVTLLSSEYDYAAGYYTEYYTGFEAADRTVYCDVLNTLKTISELNTNVKITFFDPFTQNISAYTEKYKNFTPEYGDLLISCYTDFDGNIKERKQVIKAADFFKTKTVNRKKTILSAKIENTLVTELKSLKVYRDINIAVLSDISAANSLDYVKEYLSESDYIFKTVSTESENLNGYDCIIVCAPTRDITLSEMLLLNNYLTNPDKSLIYIAPRVLRDLPNFTAFLQNWGISVYNDYRLSAAKKADCFSKSTQLLCECASPYFGKSGSFSDTDTIFVMDCCTPLEIDETVAGVTVETLLQTKGESVVATLQNGAVMNEFSANEILNLKGKFPLILKSTRNIGGNSASHVVSLASVDFINTYLTFQNDKSENYRGDYCGNLEFFTEILENLNNIHRSEPSGLTDYAITLSDKGIETTSGYSKNFIMAVSVLSVAVFVAVLGSVLIIFGKRNKNAGKQ